MVQKYNNLITVLGKFLSTSFEYFCQREKQTKLLHRNINNYFCYINKFSAIRTFCSRLCSREVTCSSALRSAICIRATSDWHDDSAFSNSSLALQKQARKLLLLYQKFVTKLIINNTITLLVLRSINNYLHLSIKILINVLI